MSTMRAADLPVGSIVEITGPLAGTYERVRSIFEEACYDSIGAQRWFDGGMEIDGNGVDWSLQTGQAKVLRVGDGTAWQGRADMRTAIEIVEAERERRAASACCPNEAVDCGDRECQIGHAVLDALADVADKLRTAGER